MIFRPVYKFHQSILGYFRDIAVKTHIKTADDFCTGADFQMLRLFPQMVFVHSTHLLGYFSRNPNMRQYQMSLRPWQSVSPKPGRAGACSRRKTEQIFPDLLLP